MRLRYRSVCAFVLLAGLARAAASESEASQVADLELLLAVDVSASVDANEYLLQQRALADAFRHPDVVSAIRAAAPNGVAVAMMQWAGPGQQIHAIPWSVISDRSTASVFADRVGELQRPPTYGGTAIGDALIVGLSLLTENNFDAARQVIDVSGDGRANQGISPGPVRNYVASLGITVNGLVVQNEEPQLLSYYQQRVIGGPGAFVLQANDFEDFADAIRMKLLREILGTLVTEASPGVTPIVDHSPGDFSSSTGTPIFRSAGATRLWR